MGENDNQVLVTILSLGEAMPYTLANLKDGLQVWLVSLAALYIILSFWHNLGSCHLLWGGKKTYEANLGTLLHFSVIKLGSYQRGWAH